MDTRIACLLCLVRRPGSAEGTWGSARLLRPWLKHRGKHGLNDGLTRRSGQRYPGQGVSSPWILAVPACRARLAGQAAQKGHGVSALSVYQACLPACRACVAGQRPRWIPCLPAYRARVARQWPRKGRVGSARLLLPWLKHRGKHGLNDGLTRRSGQRYPGRGVGSPWIPAVPACRARFAGQALRKGHGGLPVPCDHG